MIKMREKPKSVAETIGLAPNRVWRSLGDKFRGYELSNDGYVRSTKLFYAEGGCLVKPKINKKGEARFSLVDSDGNKHNLNYDDITNLVNSSKFNRVTQSTEIQSASRNKRTFQKKEKVINGVTHEVRMPKFTILKDSTKVVTYQQREIICPIYNLDRPTEVYYGR